MIDLKSKLGQGNLFGFILIFIVFLVVFGIITIMVYPAFSDLNTDVQADSDFSVQMKSVVSDAYSRYPSWADGAFVFFFAAVAMILMVLPHLDLSPGFFVAAIVVFIIILVIGMNISQAHEEMMQDSELSAYTTTFPKTHWMMTHLLEILLALFVLFGVSIYLKNRS